MLAAGFSVAAGAAELGRLTVLSGVGEPLRAEIEIVRAQPAELGSLAARLATPEVFWRAGVEPVPVVQSIRVAVARRPKGPPVVTLASSEPVEEPFMSLLVQLSSRSGQSMREYPVLLEERRQRPLASPALPARDAPGIPLAPEAPAAVDGPIETAAPAARGAGHAVAPGETLATIAERYRPAGVALEQMLAALYRENQEAFLDANMNRLRAGRTLAIPDAAAIAAIAPDEAKRLVAAHREALRAAQAALKPAPGTVTDRLEVSRAEGPKPGAATAGDDVASLQHSAREANERIVLLEKTVAGLQKIVELQNRQLARLREAQLLAADPSRPGDAVASSLVPYAPRPAEVDLGHALARVLSDHWAWLATALLLAFTSWVWMPLKTARLWRKKRRRRDRAVRRAARKTHRRRVRARQLDPALGLA